MALKLRVLTKFPARVLAETGLAVELENGVYTFSLDPGALSSADTIPDDAKANLLVFTPSDEDPTVGTLELVTVEKFLTETSAVNNTRQIISGAGLTGGGDLSADRTLAVGAGAGITVNADDVALTAIADQRLMANISGGPLAASGQTLTAILDAILGNTQGALITRQGAAWVKLDPGTSGHFLKSQGAGANLTYAALPGGGDLLSSNNLSDVANIATSQQNLKLVAQGTIFNLGLAVSVAGNALTISIKNAAGSDPAAASPVSISYRNVTASTGTPSTLSLTAAASLTISSGSTLGTSNSTPFHLLVVGFNDAGTFRIGVINASAGGDIYPVTSVGIASSTAEGGAGAADSAGVFYTGTAVASKAYVVLGRLSWNATPLATAGAWANGPDRIELVSSDFKYPGDIVQVRRVSSTANTTVTGTIPIDDTVPQDTEGGTSGMSVSITPSSQANWLNIQVLHYVGTASAAHAIVALFQNVNPSAIAASLGYNSTASTVTPQMMNLTILANSVTSNSFTTRFGANTGNAGLNGNFATRYMGGVMTSWISVAEIQG